MEAAAVAGTNYQGFAGGNNSQRVVANFPKEMTKNEKKQLRKLNESLAMAQNKEQAEKIRKNAEVMREYLKAKTQLQQERQELSKFDQRKNLERKKFLKAVNIAEAKWSALKSEMEKITGTTIAKKKKQKKNTKASETNVPSQASQLEPRAAGNEQLSLVNVKKEPGTGAIETSVNPNNLPDGPKFQVTCSSDNQGPPVQRVLAAENSFLPIVPRCETCRSVLCCDKSIMLHKRLQCSSQANRA